MKIQKRHFRKRKVLGGDCLILVAGNIASGKTTLCKKLSKDLGIPYVEINNQYREDAKNVILESTGLGYKTKNIKTYFRRVFVIKCYVDRDQAFENIKTRDRVVQPHERKLSMNDFDFFDFCREDLRKLRSDITYDYREDNYSETLNSCHKFLHELKP